MWHLATPWLEIVARCAIVYAAVLVGLRLSGKREIGQMTPFDLVLILLIANAVQNAMIGNDNSLAGGLVAAAALIVLNFSVGRAARRWMPLGRLVKGHASVLVDRGIVVEDHLRREGIARDELMAALREHGVGSLDDVRLAVLEVDGSISVLKNEDIKPAEGKPHRRFRYLKR
ncbi:MAG TPA: YetF domain-containing protein [Thermoanaerobaculia bacterium]|nr:YetF domain-containing protein [Thermoanaerobaculia bacterium]